MRRRASVEAIEGRRVLESGEPLSRPRVTPAALTWRGSPADRRRSRARSTAAWHAPQKLRFPSGTKSALIVALRSCAPELSFRAALLSAVAAVIGRWLAAAQQQPAPSATFQVQVDFVDIDAVVTDERGNFVPGLTKDDFELLDDGKPPGNQRVLARRHPDTVRRCQPRARSRRCVSDVKSNAEPISGRLLRDRARRSQRRPAADEGRRQCRARAHRAALRSERHRGHHLHERANRRRPGVHVRARSAARRDRQVPGTKAAIDASSKRPISIFSSI